MITHTLALIPLIPAMAALIIPLLSLITKNRYVYLLIQLIATSITLVFSIDILRIVLENNIAVYPFGGWIAPIGIVYVADVINAIYGLIACLLAFLVSIYGFWYYRIVEGCQWLSLVLLLLLTGITGCIYTGDLFNFFVMLEVLAISSYALVAFFKKRKWAIEASVSYAFIGSLATAFFLFGVAFIYLSYGTLNIADISAKAHNISTTMDIWSNVCMDSKCYGDIALASAIAIAFMLWALTFEAGLFPNNYWLPSAYTEAPTPASAIFAGIVDKVGTYGVLRLFLTLFTSYGSIAMFRLFGIPFRDLVLYVLSSLGLITGFLGAIIMAIQKDVKRMLSYSTISHIGIIFMAMVGLTSNNTHTLALVVTGILFHSITHAIAESLAFMGLGALATVINSRRIDDMYGYGRVYPLLSISIALALLSLLGIAPLGGFFSKYTIFLALSSVGLLPYAISVIVISGISAIGYFRIIYILFIQRIGEAKKNNVLVASSICMIMSIMLIVIGIFYAQGYLYDILYNASLNISSPNGVKQYIHAVENISRIIGEIP